MKGFARFLTLGVTGLLVVMSFVRTNAVGATAPPAPPLPLKGPWHLVFDDEFTGTKLNTSNWYPTCRWAPGTKASCGTNDGSINCFLPSNLSVSRGELHLRAQRKHVHCDNGKNYGYSGAWLATTHDSLPVQFAFKYGFAEARILLPNYAAGTGFWNGFWLGPSANWFPEVDINEWQSSQPNMDNMYYHHVCTTGGKPVPGGCQSAAQLWQKEPLSQTWHIFAVDWEPHSMIFYLDGKQMFSYDHGTYGHPLSIHITYEINGRPDDPVRRSTKLPQKEEVDWVRIWQHSPYYIRKGKLYQK